MQPVTHFVICLDRSGSMEPLARAAVDAFNRNVRTIRDQAAASGQLATVSLVTFGGDVRVEIWRAPAAGLREISWHDYRPAGGTPLFDAAATAVRQMQVAADAADPNVSYVVLVITDGYENTSRLRSPEFVELLRAAQATDRWSFAFLLPPGHAGAFAAQYGVPAGNVREWELTTAGLERAAGTVDAAVASFFGLRSRGLTSTKGFFVTNLAALGAAEVQAKLTDARSRFAVLEVNRVEQIRPFVEAACRVTYEVGRAYYQLMKDELVQARKEVVLRDRATGAVYAGAEARRLLGLPDGVDVKVRPGDHAVWDVFVQSTSVNRKLVPGTRLLYRVA